MLQGRGNEAMAAEEDLRVGRPYVCLVGHLSWDHFGLGLTLVREAPSIRKREGGTVAGDCRHTGELGFSELMPRLPQARVRQNGTEDRKETPEEKLLLREKDHSSTRVPEDSAKAGRG